MTAMRRCSTCKQEKPTSDFYALKKGGWHGACKLCVNKRAREYRTSDPIRLAERLAYRREWGKKPSNARMAKARKYGLSLQEYDEKVESQNARCAICGRELPLQVDHNHDCCATEASSCGRCNRGMLCTHCNSGISRFDDDPERLIAAAEYLEKWKAAHNA